MNTTWYLHSHVVWLKLSNLSIVASSPLVCLAAHEGKSPRWTHLEMSNFYCHPGRAGGTPFGIRWELGTFHRALWKSICFPEETLTLLGAIKGRNANALPRKHYAKGRKR